MHQDLARMCAAVRIHDLHTFSLDAELYTSEDDTDAPEGQPEERLRERLTEGLYQQLYLGKAPSPARRRPAPSNEFRQKLWASVETPGPWEQGWTQVDDPDSCVVVSPTGLRFRVRPADVDPHAGVVDGFCRVRLPARYARAMPGYFLVRGSHDVSFYASTPVVRLYWHLTARAAPELLRLLARELNQAGIAFRAKVLATPEDYRRPDAGVVYLPRSELGRAAGPIGRCYRALQGDLRPATPGLTLRLAPGLAAADDPGDGESFGQHRCRIVATAAWNSFDAGPAHGGVTDWVIREFGRRRLDPMSPHLGADGGSDFTSLVEELRPDPATAPAPDGAGVPAVGGHLVDHDRLLEATARIAEEICRSAIWDGESCLWTGRVLTAAEGAPRLRSVSLGADLYGGAAGVALFLAAYAARTGDPAARRTARGALAAVVAMIERGHGSTRVPGLYVGASGVALAAEEVGRLVDAEDLSEQVMRWWRRRLRDSSEWDREPHRDERPLGQADDVMAGRAGRLLALVSLAARVEGLESAVDAIAGDLAGAVRACLPDPSDDYGDSPPALTGISHGTSGIAAALLTTLSRTATTGQLDAVRRAWAYDDHHFDPSAANWVDLRPDPSAVHGSAKFMTAWCHGAAGIALCRLLARELDPAASEHTAWARVALDTVSQVVVRQPVNATTDLTLCHGLGGLVYVLATGSAHLPDSTTWAAAAQRAAQSMADLVIRAEPGPQPTASGGPNPSLMVGTAGVGHLFLALTPGPAPTVNPLLPGLSLPVTP